MAAPRPPRPDAAADEVARIAAAAPDWATLAATARACVACPELAAPDRWKTVAKALADQGYSEQDIQKILGLNWVRAFKAILPP